jgi:hypothetical protein
MKPFSFDESLQPFSGFNLGTGVGVFLATLILMLLLFAFQAHPVFADGTTLPGSDASSQMESAGTLLRFIDTGIFKWGARLLAGLCIFGAAWSLKEGRYGPAVISVVSAVLFGTAPSWVKNIFAVGGSDSVFTSTELSKPTQIVILEKYSPVREVAEVERA